MSPQLRVTPITAAQPALPGPSGATGAAGPSDGTGSGEAASGEAISGGGEGGGEHGACDALPAAGGENARRDGGGGDGGCQVDTLLEVHQLVFDRWQPVWTDFRHSARSVVLHIPVNATWRTANYRLQVGGLAATFSVPTHAWIHLRRLVIAFVSSILFSGQGEDGAARLARHHIGEQYI